MKILIYDSGVGAASLVERIIHYQIKNEYYLYIDNNNFPLGNKSEEELLYIFDNCIKYCENNHFTTLIIACNTMSLIYLKNKEHANKIIVFDILEYNLKLLNKNTDFICTERITLEMNDRRFIKVPELIFSIEKKSVLKIIEETKKLNLQKKVILGCTHLPLVKNILSDYHPETIFIDGTDNLIKDLPNNDKSIHFIGNEFGEKILKDFIYFLA